MAEASIRLKSEGFLLKRDSKPWLRTRSCRVRGEPHGQFARGRLGLLERKFDNRGADIVGEAVSHPARPCRSILQRFGATGHILIVPAAERGARHADLSQSAPRRKARLLDDPDDLELLGCGIGASRLASPNAAFVLQARRRNSSRPTELVDKRTICLQTITTWNTSPARVAATPDGWDKLEFRKVSFLDNYPVVGNGVANKFATIRN